MNFLLLVVLTTNLVLGEEVGRKVEGGMFTLDVQLLRKLGNKEDKIVPLLREMVASCGGKENCKSPCQTAVLRYLDRVPVCSGDAGPHKENPFSAYKLIHRVGKRLALANSTCSKENENFAVVFISLFDQFVSSLGLNFPSRQDIADASDGMLRLQETYQMSVPQFTPGKLAQYSFNLSFSLEEIIILANMAKNLHMFDMNIEYLSLALDIAPANLKLQVSGLLLDAISKHNEKWAELSNETESERLGLFVEPIQSGEPLPMQTFTKLRQQVVDGVIPPSETLTLPNLCAGSNFQNQSEKAKLKCWYETGSNPYFLIAPLKIESVWTSARINLRLIHNAVGNGMISELYGLANEKMGRSMVTLDNLNKDEFTNERTSIQTTLKSTQTPFLLPLYKDVEMLTGLKFINPEKAEKLQLTDVELGGATAFPELGVAVSPLKGAALIWNNIHLTDGTQIEESLHT
ncbi:prolyl 4-hydroxylase subunit alpha-2-like [Folsomia candida]|uniref:prolyl 4-hydroxylase subunit alpha-2-like n=1 Tax=Folsomia candida TaxID=158441 RepID=UPI001604DBC1|nr:prolyl 4-hydroxylase subunit alpha-2-like [Folsomia candida]